MPNPLTTFANRVGNAARAFRSAWVSPGVLPSGSASSVAPNAPAPMLPSEVVDASVRLGVIPAQRAAVAPWPNIDRYPTVLGANLNLQSLASAFRLCSTGYRQQYVDQLNELLERDPHAYATLSQRILTVAGRPIDITPADSDESEKDIADELAKVVKTIVENIPDFAQALVALAWGIYHGASGQEISWEQRDGHMLPIRLHFIHSRRIAYPDPFDWSPRIWDQGMVGPGGWDATSQQLYGVKVDDFPGKFIIHTPQLRGDYPTRDGLGREIAIWMVLKNIGARGAAQYIERYGKPWSVAYYKTGEDDKKRLATDDDIAKADAAIRALGAGSLASATLPDSVLLDLFGPGAKPSASGLAHDGFVGMCNSEISKAILGQTFTTETGKYGSRSTADTGQSALLRLADYDAKCLAETVRRDLIVWIVKLNWPALVHLTPKVRIRVEDEPDPIERMGVAEKAAANGIPVDADKLGHELGLPLIPNETSEPRRMVPLKAMTIAESTGARPEDAAAPTGGESEQKTKAQTNGVAPHN